MLLMASANLSPIGETMRYDSGHPLHSQMRKRRWRSAQVKVKLDFCVARRGSLGVIGWDMPMLLLSIASLKLIVA